ncbi:hypothetical protein J2W43_005440 [Pseudomonas brassicacearum]|uniref:Uncharacterized protein n=1 Tax=Pseudomonas brassicacearum TaxID=930166 RepID=A0AAW8MJT8_9PSED|nr:hypothetical protein [Pseudomonas brassicacearum]MDR6961427.1 hypothetical protein [Pseudomonas brassicacearum]
MTINSERFKLQQLVELSIGCTNHKELSTYKTNLESFVISQNDLLEFENALREDSGNTLYKGVISLLEALASISDGHQSWAIVKLYYASFYFLRVLFGARGFGMIKCKGEIYILKIEPGQKPSRQTGKKFNGQDTRGDHKTTIYIFEKVVGVGDLLLSNTIQDGSVLEFMMNSREAVHYRHPTFSEPAFDFFENTILSDEGLAKWIEDYVRDSTGVYLFLDQHSCIATPLYLLKKVRSELSSRLNFKDPFLSSQNQTLNSLLNTGKFGTYDPFLELFRNQ